MHGEGANYNTMEHKFRVFRKEAERLREEADDGPNTDTSVETKAANASSKNDTPSATQQKGKRRKTAAKSPCAEKGKKSALKKVLDSSQESESPTKRQKKTGASFYLELDAENW